MISSNKNTNLILVVNCHTPFVLPQTTSKLEILQWSNFQLYFYSTLQLLQELDMTLKCKWHSVPTHVGPSQFQKKYFSLQTQFMPVGTNGSEALLKLSSGINLIFSEFICVCVRARGALRVQKRGTHTEIIRSGLLIFSLFQE
jgi:hypothetical protein